MQKVVDVLHDIGMGHSLQKLKLRLMVSVLKINYINISRCLATSSKRGREGGRERIYVHKINCSMHRMDRCLP
jgi:hypothetical protein